MLIGISGKMGSGKNLVCTIIQGLTAAKKHNIENPSFEWIKKYYINSIWEQKAFAGKLKQTASLLTGIPVEKFEDQEFKNTELPEEWWKYEVSWHEHAKVDGVYNTYEEACEELRNFGGSSFDEKDAITTIKLTPRLLLQIIGTECIRDKVHPNAWVNALFADYKYEIHRSEVPTRAAGFIDQHVYPNWIITDMRFPNELEAVKSRGGITIRVNRTLPCGDVQFNGTQEEWEELVKKNKEQSAKFNHPSETALDNAEFDYIIDNSGTIEDLIHTVSLILKKEKII